jgi:hypothetical protein
MTELQSVPCPTPFENGTHHPRPPASASSLTFTPPCSLLSILSSPYAQPLAPIAQPQLYRFPTINPHTILHRPPPAPPSSVSSLTASGASNPTYLTATLHPHPPPTPNSYLSFVSDSQRRAAAARRRTHKRNTAGGGRGRAGGGRARRRGHVSRGGGAAPARGPAAAPPTGIIPDRALPWAARRPQGGVPRVEDGFPPAGIWPGARAGSPPSGIRPGGERPARWRQSGWREMPE